jgi:hypothetical protein
MNIKMVGSKENFEPENQINMSMDEKSPSALEAAKSTLPETTDNENEQTDTQYIEEPLATVPTKNSVNVPYSAFKRSQKHTIVAIVALAGLASTLSANIYFPALNAIQAVSQALTCGIQNP